MDLRPHLEALIVGRRLSADAAAEIAEAVAGGGVEPLQLAALLALLAQQGETAEVVFGFARVMRKHAVHVAWGEPSPLAAAPPPPPLVDIVGTGGDGHDSVNISTAAAVLAAACGVHVAKHGSVSVSSRSGSADVLLQLGVPHLPPRRIAPCLARAGIAFMFAPLFHPALKAVAPVRRALRVRTLFNILGPLLNPAGARRLVLGVYRRSLLPVYAEAVARLGAEHALIVYCVPEAAGGHSGSDCEELGGLDELAPVGRSHAVEVVAGAVTRSLCVDPSAFSPPVPRYAVADLRGGAPADNAAIIRHVLAGAAAWGDAAAAAALPAVPAPAGAECTSGASSGGSRTRPPHVAALAHAVALNAGACLYVAGRAASIEAGYHAAYATLRAGAAARTLSAWAAAAQALAAEEAEAEGEGEAGRAEGVAAAGARGAASGSGDALAAASAPAAASTAQQSSLVAGEAVAEVTALPGNDATCYFAVFK